MLTLTVLEGALPNFGQSEYFLVVVFLLFLVQAPAGGLWHPTLVKKLSLVPIRDLFDKNTQIAHLFHDYVKSWNI